MSRPSSLTTGGTAPKCGTNSGMTLPKPSASLIKLGSVNVRVLTSHRPAACQAAGLTL